MTIKSRSPATSTQRVIAFPSICTGWARAAAAIVLVIGNGAAATAASRPDHTVLTYEYKDCGELPSVFEFPLFRHDAGGAGDRINTRLHMQLLETAPPPTPLTTPLHLSSDHWMNGRVIDVETDVAHVNDGRVVTVTTSFSKCFSSAPPESMSYAFDARDGRLLVEDELFTADGRKKLKARLFDLRRKVIAREIRRLQMVRSKTKTNADSAQIETFLDIYRACLRDRFSVEAQRRDDSLLITHIGQGHVVFGKARCFPNVLVTEDALGNFYNKLGRGQLAPYLTGYGRFIFFGT